MVADGCDGLDEVLRAEQQRGGMVGSGVRDEGELVEGLKGGGGGRLGGE
jgi:hypothetical protein